MEFKEVFDEEPEKSNETFGEKMKKKWKESPVKTKIETVTSIVGLGAAVVVGVFRVGTGINEFKASKAKVELFHNFEEMASEKGLEELLKKK